MFGRRLPRAVELLDLLHPLVGALAVALAFHVNWDSLWAILFVGACWWASFWLVASAKEAVRRLYDDI